MRRQGEQEGSSETEKQMYGRKVPEHGLFWVRGAANELVAMTKH